MVERGYITVADVNREDHDRRERAGRAETAQLVQVSDQVAAAVAGRRAAGAQILEFGETLDDGQ